jgi:hypothetical protein
MGGCRENPFEKTRGTLAEGHLRAAVRDALATDRLRATDEIAVFGTHPYTRSSGLARGFPDSHMGFQHSRGAWRRDWFVVCAVAADSSVIWLLSGKTTYRLCHHLEYGDADERRNAPGAQGDEKATCLILGSPSCSARSAGRQPASCRHHRAGLAPILDLAP